MKGTQYGRNYMDKDIESRMRVNKMLDKLDELEEIVDRIEILVFGRSQTYLYPDVYDDTTLTNPTSNYREADPKVLELTPKMRRFVDEYPKDLNAKAAAIRAGYATKTAAQRAAWLLTHPKVVRALRRKLNQIARRNKVTQDRVIREIARIAFSNIRDYVKWTDSAVRLIPSDSLTREDTASIKEISETNTPRSTTIKIKLYDKPQALHTLCKYLGILDGDTDREKDQLKQAKEKLRPYIGRLVNAFDTTTNKSVKSLRSSKKDEQQRVDQLTDQLDSQFDDNKPERNERPKEITLSDELPDNVISLDKKLKYYERRLGMRD